MVDILCGLGGGEFVLDGDFLEGLGAVFGAFGAVAGKWNQIKNPAKYEVELRVLRTIRTMPGR